MSVYTKTLTPTQVFDNPFHAIFTENLRMSNNLKYLIILRKELDKGLQVVAQNSSVKTAYHIIRDCSYSMMKTIKI